MKTLPESACLFVISLLLTTACSAHRPLRGGHAVTQPKSGGGVQQTLSQGENPAQPTRQNQEMVKVCTYTVPTGSRFEEAVIQNAPSGAVITNIQSFILSAPMPVSDREETHAQTELGAAQKDTAGEIGAKLSSLHGIVWIGLALFVFGSASLAWPPLKAIVGSVTTSAALALGGLALVILPTLVVGNELLILGIVTLGIGAWFLAHRHGKMRGMISALENLPGSTGHKDATAPTVASATK